MTAQTIIQGAMAAIGVCYTLASIVGNLWPESRIGIACRQYAADIRAVFPAMTAKQLRGPSKAPDRTTKPD